MADMDPGLRREDNKGRTVVSLLNRSLNTGMMLVAALVTKGS
jgi:hypothetical protein